MRLEEIRLAAGLSRPQLAKMSGVNVRTIEKYEQGTYEAKFDNAQKLCDVLGCTIEILMGRDERRIKVIKEVKIRTIVLD